MYALDSDVQKSHNLGKPLVTADENALFQRYTREREERQALTFEFTRDPALLHQYYELYERECRVAFHVPGYKEAEEKYNQNGHILIARQGNLCVGGGRLSIRTPRKTDPLPLELDGFRLADHIPELELKQMRYGEFSRLVLLPEFRGGDTTVEMWRHFYRKCVALDLDIVFACAPLPNLRVYGRYSHAIGMKETKLYRNIELPPYPSHDFVKDYLLGIVIDKSVIRSEDWNGPAITAQDILSNEDA